MRRVAIVVCLVTFGLLAGCSSSPNTAVIHGVLEKGVAGGPPPGVNTRSPTAGTVEVLQGSKVIATVRAGSSGKFLLRLVPGTYLLTAVGFAGAQWCAPTVVRARANTTASTDVACVAQIS